MARTIQELVDYLDALQDRAPLADLMIELSQLEITWHDVAEFARFSDTLRVNEKAFGGAAFPHQGQADLFG